MLHSLGVISWTNLIVNMFLQKRRLFYFYCCTYRNSIGALALKCYNIICIAYTFSVFLKTRDIYTDIQSIVVIFVSQ